MYSVHVHVRYILTILLHSAMLYIPLRHWKKKNNKQKNNNNKPIVCIWGLNSKLWSIILLPIVVNMSTV